MRLGLAALHASNGAVPSSVLEGKPAFAHQQSVSIQYPKPTCPAQSSSPVYWRGKPGRPCTCSRRVSCAASGREAVVVHV